MRHAAAAALLLALAACDGGGGSATPSGSATATRTFSSDGPTRRPTSDAPRPTTSPPSPVPLGTGSPSAAATTAPPEPGATYDLSAQRPLDCSYVPNGSIDGRDVLNVGFYVVLVGASSLSPVEVTGRSDTGMAARLETAARNRAQTVLQFAVRGEDWGRTHQVEITVDPSNRYRETDEANNTLTFVVRLPAPRPDRTVDPIACG